MDSPNDPRAAGCLLAAAILIGAGIGIALGEPSLGAVLGTAAGLALAVLLRALGR